MNEDDVLNFWFGSPGGPEFGRPRAEWWKKDAAFDAQVRARFGRLVERALAGELDDWRGRPKGALAYVVTLDQFPRNVFRASPRAFAGDARALGAAGEAVARGFDSALLPVQRGIFYLPFMHSERLADQRRSLELYAALAGAAPDVDQRSFAKSHFDIVARFGRFPHRNVALGRASTPEELRFLETPGSSF